MTEEYILELINAPVQTKIEESILYDLIERCDYSKHSLHHVMNECFIFYNQTWRNVYWECLTYEFKSL